VSRVLEIEFLGHRGDGIAQADTGPVYVRYALPGEAVSAEPIPGEPDRLQLLRIDRESPDRITPLCVHFGVCGGCAVQHWAEARYREWKRELVTSALGQARLEPPVRELVDAHGEGRRRVTLHARRGVDDILQVGFSAPRAHQIIPIDRCPILVPALANVIPLARKLAEAIGPLRKPLDLSITAADNGLDVDARGSGPLPPRVQQKLAGIAASERLARLTRHGEVVLQPVQPEVQMGRATVPLPPGAFLQATAAGEQALAMLVLTHATRAKRVADLFCGTGPFALRLAEFARVAAFDSDAPAVAALQKAAAQTQGLRPVIAQTRDLFRRPLVPQELNEFDAVVFDPPRQGAEAQARQLAASRVKKVIAVSCNPATFARDARILLDGGYRVTEVTPVDQFRHSAHVELVGVLER
jgi:23S rRNA (uracil1939-C5)-methyltransferase